MKTFSNHVWGWSAFTHNKLLFSVEYRPMTCHHYFAIPYHKIIEKRPSNNYISIKSTQWLRNVSASSELASCFPIFIFYKSVNITVFCGLILLINIIVLSREWVLSFHSSWPYFHAPSWQRTTVTSMMVMDDFQWTSGCERKFKSTVPEGKTLGWNIGSLNLPANSNKVTELHC